MPNQKISELTAIVTVDNSVDVLPIVDISANTTKKVTPNALKTALALDNVNNTSDANKPVSIAQQDALNAKVDENAPIVAATKTKITYDAKGLVTAGDILDASDMPTGINAANIGTGVVSSTEFGYLDGVTSAIQTQLNAKQATLVSGTNIKTVNSTSLLGSGDIAISASPSGVSGAIQFSNGSAFASDAANFFWDDTNNRLGVGTNTPTGKAQIITDDATSPFAYSSQLTQLAGSALQGLLVGYSSTNGSFISSVFPGNSFLNMTYTAGEHRFSNAGTIGMTIHTNGNTTIGNGTTSLSARLGIKGIGSTSATTSLLVQNSAGTNLLQVRDDGAITMGDNVVFGRFYTSNSGASFPSYSFNGNSQAGMFAIPATANAFGFGTANTERMRVSNGGIGINTLAANNASATLQIDSTTQGVLFPRMTTTQKNAIASPAAGLVLYDSTTNKLQCYNGSTWNDLF
jgi:hypothetical protein